MRAQTVDQVVCPDMFSLLREAVASSSIKMFELMPSALGNTGTLNIGYGSVHVVIS